MKQIKALCFALILVISTNVFAQNSYRDIPWGSSKNATRKIAIGYYGETFYETESKLIFPDLFQGNDAVYTFFFQDDSLHTVAIKSELPYLLTDEESFSEMFNKSEKEINALVDRISGKYGQAILNEQIGTDLFLRWEVDDTEIELFVERSYKYKILLTYRWIPFFERRRDIRQQQYQNEL
ncbi:MAG: hypothetical protein R6V39_09015 [Desulfovibrionales bacterium]